MQSLISLSAHRSTSRIVYAAVAAVLSSIFTISLLLGLCLVRFSSPADKTVCLGGRRDSIKPLNGASGGLHDDSGQGSETRDSPEHSGRYAIEPYLLRGPVPWEELPKKVQDDFTLNGSILAATWHFTNGAENKVYSKQMVQEMVFYADSGEAHVPGGKALSIYGPDVNQMFFDALKEFPVKDKSVLVVGSEKPWVEALCITHAAANITIVDYNLPDIQDPRITAVSIKELDSSTEHFDTIVCFNSIQSDGLGRYGEPINPWADLEHMRKLRGLLKPGGKMFFGVTMGNDTVHFNAHRIYGKILFPRLIQGWKLERMFGGSNLEQFYGMAPMQYAHPLLILSVQKNPLG